MYLSIFLSLYLSAFPLITHCAPSLSYQVNKIPPSLNHASFFEWTAFISVMDRWTPQEICLLLSHLANSFHGLPEKENKTWHIYPELLGESGSGPHI